MTPEGGTARWERVPSIERQGLGVDAGVHPPLTVGSRIIENGNASGVSQVARHRRPVTLSGRGKGTGRVEFEYALGRKSMIH